MKMQLSRLILSLGIALLVPGLSADVEGLWWTEGRKALIRVEACGEQELCGTIVKLGRPLDDDGNPRTDVENPEEALRDRPVLGLEILRIPDRPNRKGVRRKGRIYDPEKGATYKCNLWEDDGTLIIKGYVGITLLGRKTRWTAGSPDELDRAVEGEP